MSKLQASPCGGPQGRPRNGRAQRRFAQRAPPRRRRPRTSSTANLLYATVDAPPIGALRVQISHEPKTIHELKQMKQEINLNPAWQRGAVWSVPKQALLVDSILRGYDIPMIYLRECPEDNPFPFEVVDGQQRLRSLWNFLEGELALPDDFANIDGTPIGGQKFHDLPRKMRKGFEAFKVIVATIADAREPEISRVFSRMQMGVRLNPAELRNAVQTGLRHAIDGLAHSHPFFSATRIPRARFKHQDYLAHAISICLHEGERGLKAPQLMDDYLHVTDADIYGPIVSQADELLSYLERVNTRASRRLTQKWMFVDLFYMLYQNRDSLDNIRLKRFSETYIEFDKERLEHVSDPGRLLLGVPTKVEKALYDYIVAFKVSGAERSNLEQRNRVLRQRFRTVLTG